MNIGKRLRELREARGLSQRGFGQRSGLARCYVSQVENGHKIPTLRTLEKWAEALGIELYEILFVGEGKPQPLPLKLVETEPVERLEAGLLEAIKGMSHPDRELLLSLVLKLIKQRV
jgi:transcriptional regulator with XRE-family HTH domain